MTLKKIAYPTFKQKLSYFQLFSRIYSQGLMFWQTSVLANSAASVYYDIVFRVSIQNIYKCCIIFNPFIGKF